MRVEFASPGTIEIKSRPIPVRPEEVPRPEAEVVSRRTGATVVRDGSSHSLSPSSPRTELGYLTADQAMLTAARRAARCTPWMPLLHALLELAGGKAELLRHAERAWASVTFSGTRHDVAFSFSGAEAVAAGEALIAALPDHEFTIPRQLVADATVLSVEHTVLPEPRLVVEVRLLLLDDT